MIADIMNSMMSTGTFLLRSARLVSSHQASLSRSALVYSDIQLKDKLREAKKQEVINPYFKVMFPPQR